MYGRQDGLALLCLHRASVPNDRPWMCVTVRLCICSFTSGWNLEDFPLDLFLVEPKPDGYKYLVAPHAFLCEWGDQKNEAEERVPFTTLM